jgi:hypothetical protein
MKSIIAIIFIATVSLATPAAAYDAKGRWFAQGVYSCGDWLEAQRKDNWERVSSHNWLAGFLAGANLYRRGKKNYLEGTDVNSAVLWINKYCADNPLDHSGDAAYSLIEELAGRP